MNRFWRYRYDELSELTRGDRLRLAVLDLFDLMVTLLTGATFGSNYGTHFMMNRSKKRLEHWHGVSYRE
jgi:hypothetical protein